MWQDLAAEFAPFGVDVVVIGVDVDPAACYSSMDRAATLIESGNSLIDRSHETVSALNFRNVPMALWVNADGTVALGAHQSPVVPGWGDRAIPEGIPERIAGRLELLKAAPDRHETYLAALREWVKTEVVPQADAQGLTENESRAMAAFEMGDHLRLMGNEAGSVECWRAAHQLDPANWAAKRQAWSLVTSSAGSPRDLIQENTGPYEGNWLDDVRAAGGIAGYYPQTPW